MVQECETAVVILHLQPEGESVCVWGGVNTLALLSLSLLFSLGSRVMDGAVHIQGGSSIS